MIPEVANAISGIIPEAGPLPGKSLVFGGTPTRRTFERHLAKAGIAYKLDGRVVSLRKTLASHLIALGAKPAELQLIMRHRHITTTYQHYRDPKMINTSGAMASLSKLGITPGPSWDQKLA